MASSEEYLSKIETILGSPIRGGEIGLQLSWNSISEAQALLKRIRQIQKELRLLKKDVRQTMQGVRSSFIAQKAEVQAGFLATLAGRKAAGRDRAIKRENLRRQQLASLAPYENVTRIIDEALVKLGGVKLSIDSWIPPQK